jgi:hypothetical protein
MLAANTKENHELKRGKLSHFLTQAYWFVFETVNIILHPDRRVFSNGQLCEL